MKLTVVIPTYNREQVLLDTLDQLLALDCRADEILVIDQTPEHQAETNVRLKQLANENKITWRRIERPSIPTAMNLGLQQASGDIVLFLDDDIEITSALVEAHAREYLEEGVDAVVGQVVQSWQQPLAANVSGYPVGLENDPDAFQFNSSSRCEVKRIMAGNLSVRKRAALRMGGFDENFVRVAYRFEAEFAERFVNAGHRIIFQPNASIRHLKVPEGGTRAYGEHLTTISPSHAVGRYYYMLTARNVPHRATQFLSAPFSSVMTRFHLRRPWWIPVTLVSELGGMLWALGLRWKGPQLLPVSREGAANAD
jgi:glycosyltransferase involved in cell wall biosynthesis